MKLSKTLIPLTVAIGSALAVSTVMATPVYQPMGPNLTYGDISNGQTIISNITNPAAGAVALESGESEYRFGLLSSVGVGLEVGPVDSMVKQLQDLNNQLNGPSLTYTQAQSVINQFDSVLVDAGKNGYVRGGFAMEVPIMPIVITNSGIGGSFVIDANVGAEGQMSVLDSPMQYNTATSQIDTATSLYVKGAAQGELSMGYSTSIWKPEDSGQLYLGLRAKYIQMSLRKTLVAINTNQDIGTIIQDQYSKDPLISSKVAADAGLLWVSEHYRLGVTVTNINEPTFAYASIGGDCSGLTGTDQQVCNSANAFSDRIALNEVHKMNSQVKWEGALYSQSRNWVLGFGYDANPAVDPLGNEIQNATVSAAYAGSIAGLRVGYRKNMAGSQLSEAMFGMTLFSFLNLDFAYGLEPVKVDGNTYPRTAAFNLGLELTF